MPAPTGQHLGTVIRTMMEQARVATAGIVAQHHQAAQRERLEAQAAAASSALEPVLEALWGPVLDAGALDDELHAVVAQACGRTNLAKPAH